MDEDEDFDPIVEDCGESSDLCDEDAKRTIAKYNRVLEDLVRPLPIPGRTDPRSVLYGL